MYLAHLTYIFEKHVFPSLHIFLIQKAGWQVTPKFFIVCPLKFTSNHPKWDKIILSRENVAGCPLGSDKAAPLQYAKFDQINKVPKSESFDQSKKESLQRKSFPKSPKAHCTDINRRYCVKCSKNIHWEQTAHHCSKPLYLIIARLCLKEH